MELIVLAGFMCILFLGFVVRWWGWVVNIYFSLLSFFCGLYVQCQVFEVGVKISGCIVHFVDEGTDIGSIIVQVVVFVRYDDTEESFGVCIFVEEHWFLLTMFQVIVVGQVFVVGSWVVVDG